MEDLMKALRALTIALFAAGPGFAVHADPIAEAIADYMDFAPYEAGIILPAQLDQDVFEAAVFVDTRDAQQFASAHIPGAVNIEWREIAARLDEIPDQGMVIFYCNTGTLSAQATFAARLMGRENVLVLQTGLLGWQQEAAYRP
jgi:rhodanese-related sulfurtransferase